MNKSISCVVSIHHNQRIKQRKRAFPQMMNVCRANKESSMFEIQFFLKYQNIYEIHVLMDSLEEHFAQTHITWETFIAIYFSRFYFYCVNRYGSHLKTENTRGSNIDWQSVLIFVDVAAVLCQTLMCKYSILSIFFL